MPNVTINWLEGRSVEQKTKLMKSIANAFDEIGIDGNKVHIMINDFPRTNWMNNKIPATNWEHIKKNNNEEE